MILRLCAPFEDAQLLTCIERGGGNDFQQMRFAHVMRAGATYEYPARFEKPECTQIDLFVSAACAFERTPRLCKRRRIDDNDVEFRPDIRQVRQVVKNVG